MAINPLQPPVNYLGMIPQLDLAKQFEGFGEALAERQKRTQAEEVKTAYKTDLQAVLDNPSMKAFNQFALKYPQQREVIKDVAGRFSTEQQDAEFNIGRDIAVALENNQPDVALNLLTQTVDARKTSNLPPSIYGQVQKILSNTDDPDRINKAKFQTNFALNLLNPEKMGKVVENLEKQKLAPEAFKEQEAKARKALQEAINAEATATDDTARAKAAREKEEAEAKLKAIEADFARAKTVLDVQQQAATLRKTDADILINKENARIAALNAAAAKELNAVKRDEILQRREEATDKRDQAKRDQDSLLGNQLSSIDNFLNTAIRATNTPLDVREAATGPVASRFIPTLRQATADFEGLIETLGAQAFLAQIPQIKGTGSLSENEGNKLQASLQNLSLKQSPERLQENINEAVRLLTKARENIAIRSGKAVVPPDTPAARPIPPQSAIDFLKKDPSLRGEFEKKYGPNSASQYLKAN